MNIETALWGSACFFCFGIGFELKGLLVKKAEEKENLRLAITNTIED